MDIKSTISGGMSLDRKRSLEQKAMAGDYDAMMRILKDAGYDGSDGNDPKKIGELVKRYVR